MGKLAEMRQEYESIPIPEELSFRIQMEIEESRKKQAEKTAAARKRKARRMLHTAEAAAICIVFLLP